jgi:hypothetical protein
MSCLLGFVGSLNERILFVSLRNKMLRHFTDGSPIFSGDSSGYPTAIKANKFNIRNL